MSSMPSLLAVFPLSRFDASLVALRIRSVRLVVLPRDSMSRTASMLSLGGRFVTGILLLIPGLLMPRPNNGFIEFAELGVCKGAPADGGSRS